MFVYSRRVSAAADRSGEGQPSACRALGQFGAALDQLITAVESGGLDQLGDEQLLTFLESFERCRNRMAVVNHRLVLDGERRALPDALTQPSMAKVLVALLRLSPAEASRRVAAAQACGERVSMQGEVLTPVRPQLAAAQRDGTVSPEQVHIIAAALAKVDRPGLDAAAVVAGEGLLTRFAATFGAKDLKHLAEQTVDAIDPDGTLPSEQLSADRRHLTVRRCADGMYAGEFRLTGPVGAKLTALLQPLTTPRIDRFHAADGRVVQEVDGRTFGQRSHDALEEVCDRLLQAGDVVGIGGTPATVIVTVSLDDLVDKLGYGKTSDGALIPVAEVLRLAHQADIVPAVMNNAGSVLALGRTRRMASASQTHALIARDQGCSFPGCDRPPEWCERHHIREWADGGLTDLENLTLLCRYHHHNFAGRGWHCRMNVDGLPEWVPPQWIDRSQQPLINSRIASQLHEWRRHRSRPRAGRPTSPQPTVVTGPALMGASS